MANSGRREGLPGARVKKHCATCTCTSTPLELLASELGQTEAARRLGTSQGHLSRCLSGGFTHARLKLELLAATLK